MMKEITRPCELCSGTAVIYCPSDSAYLCSNCDFSVHSANFLVARHHRSSLCNSCGDWRRSGSFSCESCGKESYPVEEEEEEVSSLSSTESSTAGEASSGMRRCRVLDTKHEGVLVNWCNRLGIEGDTLNDVVLATSGVLEVTTFVPVRVALATSFWLGLRYRGDTCRDLKVVERITGVPGRMILAVVAKVKRVLKTRGKVTRHVDELKEGWAEC